ILYAPNLPKNDTETLQNAQVLANLGTESKQTIREVVYKYTGINSDTEEQRVEDEDKKDLDADPMQQVFKRVTDNSNENEPKDDDSKKADNPSMLDKIKGFFGGGK